MAITVNGTTYRTLSDRFFVGDTRILGAYVNDEKVYPDYDGKRYVIRMHLVRPRTEQVHHAVHRVFLVGPLSRSEILSEITKDLGGGISWDYVGMQGGLYKYAANPTPAGTSTFVTQIPDRLEEDHIGFVRVYSGHVATYEGDVDVIISSSRPFGRVFDGYRQSGSSNSTYYPCSGYVTNTSTGETVIAYSAQPYSSDDAETYRYEYTANMINGVYPLIEIGSILDISVVGTVTCGYVFHDKNHVMQSDESRRWTEHFSACQGDINESCSGYVMESISAFSSNAANVTNTICLGTGVGKIDSRTVVNVTGGNNYIALMDLFVRAPNIDNPESIGPVICHFKVNGYEVLSE